jgi:hypothetical protein
MKTSALAWAAAGTFSVTVVAALVWRIAASQAGAVRDEGASPPPRESAAAAGGSAEPRAPRSEVFVLDPLVPPVPTAVPGTVTVEPGTGSEAGRTVVRWELGFPRGVWSLRFVLGSPDVELRFLDLTRTVSEDCHALSAITERGAAPFPDASFEAATRTVTLADMPLEVVEALSRARELALVACDTRFTLDDAQRRVLIDFYVQTTGVILDAVSADAGARVAGETR